MIEDTTHYAARGTQATACGLHRDGRHAVTLDSDRVDCPGCQAELAQRVAKRLHPPPVYSERVAAGFGASAAGLTNAVFAVAPWAVRVEIKERSPATVVLSIFVEEDVAYYTQAIDDVAEALRPILSAGVMLEVRVRRDVQECGSRGLAGL